MRETLTDSPAGNQQISDDDATIELEALERTDSLAPAVPARGASPGLEPEPIPQSWILEGNPVARTRPLAGSSDGLSSTHMWECTAGRFAWHYEVDEVIHVLEGTAVVESASGLRRCLMAGDTFLFPAGSRFEWTVPRYIREVAFLHTPLSRRMRIAQRIWSVFSARVRRG